MTQITSKEASDAAGTGTDRMVMSMVLPCCTNVVFICEKADETMMLVIQTGSRRSRILSSST